MQPINYADYCRARRDERYLRHRWGYYRQVIAMAMPLAPRTVLEIGPGPLPLFPNGDRLDVLARFRPTYLHDATAVPWPVATKAYDLAIALQVWEHLDGRQYAAFQELRRTARHVILSVPYRWGRHASSSHRGIDDAVVRTWTGGARAVHEIVVPWMPVVFRRRRKIYLFDFTALR
ncbi:MAG: hypothetical protein GXY83_06705 [Rhodopirellula sp.]|nr:hypothetical protein [Rhodopirellula sp.]